MIWRIRGRREFARLERDGRRIRTSSLWCTYLLEPGATPPRVAFAIGRAVGPAVTRNRLRRRLRAILREIELADGLPDGYFLIGARRSATELTYVQIRTQVRSLLAKLPR